MTGKDMNMHNVKIITLAAAKKGLNIMPALGTKGAAAVDLVANISEPVQIKPQAPAILIPTGIKIDMTATSGLCAWLLPRSGLGHKQGLVLGNGTGLIDNDYQGELFVSAWNRNPEEFQAGMGKFKSPAITINPGDRIAQMVFMKSETPNVSFEHVETFEATERGEGGFGSTGVSKKVSKD